MNYQYKGKHFWALYILLRPIVFSVLIRTMLSDDSDALVCYDSPLPQCFQSSDDETLELYKTEKSAAESQPGTKDVPKDVSVKKRKKAGVIGITPTFRMNAKGFSLTFPQNTTTKAEAAARIDEKWPLVLYVISQEKHKDGNSHLHMYLEFPERKQFTSSNCFDFIGVKHGNYQSTRSRRDWIKYIIKHDTDYLAKGIDVKAILAKQAQKNKAVADLLDEGASLQEVNKFDNGYFLINKRKIEDYGTFVAIEKKRKEMIPWAEPDLTNLTDANLQIGKWLAENIRKSRPFKAPQLFIHGPRNRGKTSLIEYLERSLSIYHVSTTEDFYDGYDDYYDLVVIDEFKGQKTIQWMNEFLQGSRMTLRLKGRQYLKTKNVPVIILSNFSLPECYPKAHLDNRLETLECRLQVVEIKEFIKVF